ncbi:MAG: hypothetical protein ACTMIR_08540 [Cellulomonadaceae bacterium]
MWFWIWVALVVAALGVGVWQLWRLWRHGMDAVRRAGACADELSRTAEHATARAQGAARARPQRVPALTEDPVEVRARVADVRRRRAERAAHRRRPRPEVY